MNCIEATRFPQNPKSPEEEVLADADFYHLTKPDYPKYEQRLRKELKAYLGKFFSDQEWAETNFAFLKYHCYYTSYGKNVLQQFKEVNIDIFDSDVLTYQQRELVTISALAAMPGVEGQLQAHIGMGMNIGINGEQINEVFVIIEKAVGKEQAEKARTVFSKIKK